MRNFNSIKVRLELALPFALTSSNCYFNSIKVRLELLLIEESLAMVEYFNSIKVRLEHDIRLPLYSKLRFQFHKGTIRTKNEYDRYANDFISIP